MGGLLDPTTGIALLCGLGAALSFGLVSIALADGPTARRYKRRLQVVGRRARGVAEPPAATSRSLARRESATPGIDRIFRSWLPNRDVLVARLARTGRDISIGQYAIGTITLSMLAASALIAFSPLSTGQGALLGLAIGAALPHLLIGRLGKRRVNAFIGLFPEAIDLMVRALRSGLPISEAVITAANEVADPVGAEFRNIEGGMRLGRDLESLLWETAKRIAANEFRFFIIALSVQRETGGNLAETLNNLGEVLRRRRAMRAKVRAMSSEARASMMILGVLPVLVTVVLMVTSPDYIMVLFTDVRGLMLCGVAAVMQTIGITVMMKLARFEI